MAATFAQPADWERGAGLRETGARLLADLLFLEIKHRGGSATCKGDTGGKSA